MKSVQPIIAEIRRLAEEQRRTLAHVAPRRANRSPQPPDLLAPMRMPKTQRLPWLVGVLDRLRRRSLHAVLVQQSEYNQRLSAIIGQLSNAVTEEEDARLRMEQALQALQLDMDVVRGRLDALAGVHGDRVSAADVEVKGGAAVHGAERTPSLPEWLKGYYADPIYARLADCLRGAEETVRERQRGYVERFRAVAADGVILDVGCGRGEFVELLGAAGLHARGLDLSADNVERCRARHILPVIQADALDYMRTLASGSLAGVFAAHFIEHVPPDYLLAFVRACFECVRPGGLVIFESVNPDSLAALRIFHADPGHATPVPPATARLLLESSGFGSIETLSLSPPSPDMLLAACPDTSPLAAAVNAAFAKLNALLFAPCEYAVLATR
jgi:O-antigen chain-terminating methyltransferase